MNNKSHIIYVRFPFPLSSEPGSKRGMEMVQRYVSRGHRVTVIASNCNSMTGDIISQDRRFFIQDRDEGVETIRIAAVPYYRTSILRRLLNYALFTILAFWAGMRASSNKDEKLILLVVICPPTVVLVGYFLSRLRRKARFILEVSDLPESTFVLGMFDKPYWRFITYKVYTHIYKVSNHIITLTPGAKRHIADLGISQSKITTVTNWVSQNSTGNVEKDLIEKVRNQHGWHDHFVVMYAGGHGKAYDLMTLIRAAEILKDKQNLKIVFMGEGEHKKEYIKYCIDRELKLCEFIPPASRSTLRTYLASADVCVNLFYRGDFWKKVIGHKIFDYFEASRPIIFAGDGDTADIIMRARGGRVVPSEDPEALSKAIVDMMENLDETREMGKRGCDYLKREFDREKILSILDSVIIPD